MAPTHEPQAAESASRLTSIPRYLDHDRTASEGSHLCQQHEQLEPAQRCDFDLTTPYPVRIVEMNYHSADRPDVTDSDDMEFIELLNTRSQAVDLNNLKIDTGITYQISSSVMLGAGQRITIAQIEASSNLSMAMRHACADQLQRKARKRRRRGPPDRSAGQRAAGYHFQRFRRWPGRADGKGSTLEIINPLGAASDPDNWRSSYEYGGTPGAAGAGAVNRVVVNEVLTHEDLPQVDAIELFNTTHFSNQHRRLVPERLSSNYKKYKIPAGTTIGAGQYLVIDATQFDSASPTGGNIPFGLSSTSSDDVYLLSADASTNLLNFEDHAEFDAAANNVSFGRWPNGTGQLYPMKSLTLGAANSGPLIGPVVITELMYKPTGGNNNQQFVELQNISNQTVTFSSNIAGFGQQPWKIDGIGYSFPIGQTLAPGATLVIMGAFTTPLTQAAVTSACCVPIPPRPTIRLFFPMCLSMKWITRDRHPGRPRQLAARSRAAWRRSTATIRQIGSPPTPARVKPICMHRRSPRFSSTAQVGHRTIEIISLRSASAHRNSATRFRRAPIRRPASTGGTSTRSAFNSTKMSPLISLIYRWEESTTSRIRSSVLATTPPRIL